MTAAKKGGGKNTGIAGAGAVAVADWSSGEGVLPGRAVLGPLLLMITTPCFSIIFFHVCTEMQGDFVAFAQKCWLDAYAAAADSGGGGIGIGIGIVRVLRDIWPDPWDVAVWKMILAFMSFQLALMKLVPGKRFEATVTPKGNRPVYTANGVACYVITIATLLLLAHFDLFDPATVYDKFGNILSSMNVFAMCFCCMLLVKGYVAPSSSDSGTTGNIVQDFFWGMELYPRILGWDVKVFTNCRSGMMFWAVAIVSFCYKNMQLNNTTSDADNNNATTTFAGVQYGMLASVAIQLVYITKFFYWEMGYMCSMDIQHDRAGYYICWGCLVWVPAVYTSQAFYLTSRAPDITATTAMAIFVAGVTCVWINYDSDRQRYQFRQTDGQCLVWGRVPRKIIAKYKTTNNTGTTPGTTMKTSLLLVDGWWKVSRHFHYVPEILAAFFWSLPALDTGLVGPYFYVVYLTILLTDRAFRDDDRCRSKYGKYWDEYCVQVPYKILPGLV